MTVKAASAGASCSVGIIRLDRSIRRQRRDRACLGMSTSVVMMTEPLSYLPNDWWDEATNIRCPASRSGKLTGQLLLLRNIRLNVRKHFNQQAVDVHCRHLPMGGGRRSRKGFGLCHAHVTRLWPCHSCLSWAFHRLKRENRLSFPGVKGARKANGCGKYLFPLQPF
jgi:hypothetical protein